MECKYFGECGSCKNYEGGYEAQLSRKVEGIIEEFTPLYDFSANSIDIFKSEESHYRYRSEFRLWHVNEDNSLHYAMGRVDPKREPLLIDECPQVNIYISELMPKLLKLIKEREIDFKIFGADFLSNSSGEIVVSLLYHRRLDDEWKVRAEGIAQELNIKIIGRSRKQKVVIGSDSVVETLNIANESFKFVHIENSFTQPNARVNEKMVAWTMEQFEGCSGDLLELYCGAGNFTIPLAKKFDKVLATEISKSSINAAKQNMELNDVANIEFVRMSAEEFVEALDGVREFRRMREIDLQSYSLKNIFVDPPRAGMDEASCDFAARHDNIVYISCNPKTLARDLERLTKTHTLKKLALFDQFAYTDHIEMGAFLIRKV